MWREKRNVDNVMEVCRLCLGTDNLTSIFDDRIKIPENIIDVIQITTGVTVTAEDNISHKLCNKCLHITIKMFKFRSSSIVNDKELKAMAACKPKTCMHQTVYNLLIKYPKIKLPSSITECNMSPIVYINRNEITSSLEEYKKKRRTAKRRRKEIRAAKKLVEMEENSIADIDLENKITPHVIPNIEIFPESASIKSSEFVSPTLSPVVSPFTRDAGEVDEDKRQPHQGTSVHNIEAEESRLPNNLDNTCKRKLSDCTNSSKPKKQKTNLYPVEGEDSIDSLVTVKYANKTLLICDICNGILYNSKDLKKHKMNHMRCTLCRTVFRSMEETNKHSEGGCSIKKIMDNLPIIYLKRCDNSEEILKKYPWAFGNKSDKIVEDEIVNPVIPAQSIVDKGEVIKDTPKEDNMVSTLESKLDPEPIEIFLISDDEDEEDQSLVERDNSVSETFLDQTPKNTSISKNEKAIQISNKNASKAKNDIKCNTKTVELNSSSSTIKPNIEIIGENIIDVNLDDNDISLLKNLLKKTKRNNKETSVQTVIPCNADISPSVNKDKLFELKNLRDYLNFYKIPVNISYAAQYSVRYGNEPSPLLKKDRAWSKVNTKVSLNDITRQATKPVENSNSIALPISNISTKVTISSAVGTSAQSPQLSDNVQNSIPIVVTSVMPTSSSHTPSRPIQNIPFSTNGPYVTSSISTSIYGSTYSISPTLTSSNSPIVLNHSLQNVKYSNASLNNSLLRQTIPSQQPQKNFTIISNNVNPMQSLVASTSRPHNIIAQSVIKGNPPLSFQSLNSTVPVANNMPPPLSTIIPHRTIVPKPAVYPTMQIYAPPQSNSNSHNSMLASNSTRNETSNFVPMIRVKNVSELR